MWLPLKDMLCVLAVISFTVLLRCHAFGREVLGTDTSAATVCPDCSYSLSCSKQCTNCNAVIGSIIQSRVDCPGAAKPKELVAFCLQRVQGATGVEFLESEKSHLKLVKA